jgi:hypothetical protein
MRKRHFLLGSLSLFVGFAVACGSGGGGFGDGGTLPDASTTDSAVPDTGPDTGTGQDATTPADSGPTVDSGDDGATSTEAGATDASFSFDGFAKSDASNCFDDDGDGWTTCDGDCDDHNSLVNPCAFDTNAASGDPVGKDGIDNDCDGQIDNLRVCDGSLTAGHVTSAASYASAVDVCDNPKCQVVVGSTFYGPNNSSAHRITAHMGNNFTPHKGSYMAFLSTGIADDLIDTASYRPGDGTDLSNTFTHPSPLKAAQNINPCGTGVDEAPTVHDYSELRLTLKAPINAGSFTFDFNFFSEEYPAYVCRGFNDTFLAMLTSQQYTTPFQIAFDPNNHRINVNNSFFQDCTGIVSGDNLGYTHACAGALSLLNNTGYEIKYGQTSLTLGNLNKGSGATDWLKTTAPIQPGETFTLSFIVFDEGDGILDSAVNLDNFRWNSTTLSNPVTAR